MVTTLRRFCDLRMRTGLQRRRLGFAALGTDVLVVLWDRWMRGQASAYAERDWVEALATRRSVSKDLTTDSPTKSKTPRDHPIRSLTWPPLQCAVSLRMETTSPAAITMEHSAVRISASAAVSGQSAPASDTMANSCKGRILACPEPTKASAVP